MTMVYFAQRREGDMLMTVQDLLRAAPRDALIDFFIPFRFDEVPSDDIEAVRKGLNDWIQRLLERTPKESDSVLLAHISYVEAGRFAVSVIKRDAVEKWVADGMRVIDALPGEPSTAYPMLPEIYSIGFDDWNHVLGLQVNGDNVQAHGINQFLSAILDEMSFLGFNEEDMTKKRDEMIASMDRMDAMTPEERDAECRPWEEVLKDLSAKYGIEFHEDTPEEKEARNRELHEQVKREYVERYAVMRAYVENRRSAEDE